MDYAYEISGCEMIKCPDYKDGKCYSELDYVDRETGEDMCPHNSSAVPRIEYEQETEGWQEPGGDYVS